jgi:hypothetical protein
VGTGGRGSIIALLGIGLAVLLGLPEAQGNGDPQEATGAHLSKLRGYYAYRVSFEGSGTYAFDLDSTGPSGSVHVASDFGWNVHYGRALIPKKPVAGDLDVGKVAREGSTAEGHWSITGQGSGDGDCSRSGSLTLGGDDDIGGALEGDRNKGGLSLIAGPGWLRTGTPSAPDICDGHNFWQAWLIAASGAGATPDGNQFNDPLAVLVNVPGGDLGNRTITGQVSNADQVGLYEPFQSDCGSNDTDTCLQQFDFTGRLIMTRIRRHPR